MILSRCVLQCIEWVNVWTLFLMIFFFFVLFHGMIINNTHPADNHVCITAKIWTFYLKLVKQDKWTTASILVHIYIIRLVQIFSIFERFIEIMYIISSIQISSIMEMCIIIIYIISSIQISLTFEMFIYILL